MISNLGDILKGRAMEPPAEIKVVKDFVKAKLKADVTVGVKPGKIIITADNAALAGTLRLHLPELEKLVKSNKKLVIRIS